MHRNTGRYLYSYIVIINLYWFMDLRCRKIFLIAKFFFLYDHPGDWLRNKGIHNFSKLIVLKFDCPQYRKPSTVHRSWGKRFMLFSSSTSLGKILPANGLYDLYSRRKLFLSSLIIFRSSSFVPGIEGVRDI